MKTIRARKFLLQIFTLGIALALVVTFSVPAAAGNTNTATLPTTAGSTLYNGYVYTVSGSPSITGGTGQSALYVASGATVVICIPSGCTLTVRGGTGSTGGGGGAGIYLPSNSTLIITGGGTLYAYGGTGGNAGSGGTGSNGRVDNGSYQGGTGGTGGVGAGGGGAGIGGSGGSGGSGGTGGTCSSYTMTSNTGADYCGGSGSSGSKGGSGTSMGTLYVMGSVYVSATAGSSGSAGSGGSAGSFVTNKPSNRRYTAGGGGGGGGGGTGGSADAVGGGGYGGGGGGGGGAGGVDCSKNDEIRLGGCGGYGGASSGSGGSDAVWNRDLLTRGYGGSGGSVGSSAGSGTVYVASTATLSGRSSNGTVNVHSAIQYTVTMDRQGGSGGTSSVTGTYYFSLPSATMPTRSGYNFGGYYSGTNGTGTQYYNASGSSTNYWNQFANTSIYAYWIVKSYTITFDSNGGSSVTTASYNYGASLPTPTRAGYTFAGWYTFSGLGWRCDTVPAFDDTSAPQTLYAKWTANTYTVEYNANKPDGASGSVSGSTASSTHTYDTTGDLTSNGYSLTGWTFQGWSTSSVGAAQYANGQTVSNLTATANGTVKLYAVWKANTYTVEYNANTPDTASSAVSGSTVSSAHTYDTAKSLTSNGYSLTGWTFQGWSDTSDGAVKYTDKQTVSNLTAGAGGTVELYAVWKANTYTIEYNANKPDDASNDVSDSTASSSHTYDTAKNLTANGYSLTGWTFKGWSDIGTGTAKYTDEQTVSNLTAAAGGTVELYAVWEKNVYTLTLNANGGKGSSSTKVTYDSVPSSLGSGFAPTRLGYSFQGYYIGKNGTGEQLYDDEMNWVGNGGDYWNYASDTTAYAYWTSLKYNIDLYSSGDYVDTMSDVAYGALTLPTAEEAGITKANYTFVGWNAYDKQDWAMYEAGVTLSVGLTETEGATVYLYAAWEENEQFTVTYDANGGRGQPAAERVYIGNDYTVSASEPTWDGYSFLGWSLDSAATEATWKYGGADDTLENVTADTNLYAVWKMNPLLTYDTNGGSFSVSVTAQRVSPGEATLTDAVPVLDGYDFTGWNTQANGGGTSYSSGGSFTMPDEDVTLYAAWTPETYTIDTQKPNGYTVTYADENTNKYNTEVKFTVTPAEAGTSYNVYANGVMLSADGSGSYSFTIAADTTVLVADHSSGHFVVYNPNGGTGAPSDSTAYAANASVGVNFTAPTRNGYTFVGWAVSQTATTADYTSGGTTTFTMGVADVTLYAVWTPIEYSVSFNANTGADSATYSVGTHEYGETFTLPSFSETGFANTGCQFSGWAGTTDGDVLYTDGMTVGNLSGTNGAAVTLYAVWEPIETKIVFNANGGVLGTSFKYIYVAYGSALTDGLNPPTRDGYILTGWWGRVNENDANETLFYDADMVPQITSWAGTGSEVTITAAWEPITYSVAFYQEDTILDYTLDCTFSSVFSLPTAEFLGSYGLDISDGYHLAGWSTAMGSSLVNYSDGQEITTGLTTEDGTTVKLYAVLAEDEYYTVSYDANGGTGVPSGGSYRAGKTVSAAFNVVPSKAGYTFSGWATSSTAAQAEYKDEDGCKTFVMGTNSVILYAVWTPNTYTVSYDGNGESSGSAASTTHTYGVSRALSDGGSIAKTGYTLRGWATSALGDMVYGLGATVGNLTDEANAAIRLYAVWQPNTYTVTLTDAEDASIEYTLKVTYDSAFGALPTPAKDGYTFDGWYTTAGSGGTQVISTTIVTLTSDTILYAHWTAKDYTVFFNTNASGSAVSTGSTTVTFGQPYGTLPVPTRAGYTFAGWFTAAEDGTQITAASTVEITGNTMLYAHWSVSSYAVCWQNPSNASVAVTCGNTAAAAPTGTAVSSGGSVESGKYVCVTVTLGDGYTGSAPTVLYNGLTLTMTQDAENEKVYTGTFEMPDGDAVLTVAGVAPVTYAVSYDGNGGGDTVTNLPDTQQKVHDVSLTLTTLTPLRAGYRFAGWNTRADGNGKSYASGAAYTANRDQTLYAVWTFLNTYNVDYTADADGYTVVPYNSTSPVSSGGSYRFTLVISAGWQKTADFMVSYTSGGAGAQEITAVSGIYTIGSISGDIVISVSGVERIPETYTVTYDANGGTGAPRNGTKTQDAAYTVSADEPTREGYSFVGWATGSTATEAEYLAGYRYTNNADLTLYAVWKKNSLTITFQSGEGFSYTEDTDGTLIEGTPTVDSGANYTFYVHLDSGYSSGSMAALSNGVLLAGTVQTDSSYVQYTISNVTEDQAVGVYLNPSKIFTVSYNANGKAASVPADQTKIGGETLTLGSSVPTTANYSFTGWNTQADGGGTSYPAGAEFTSDATEANGTLTLYAQWKINIYVLGDTISTDGCSIIVNDTDGTLTAGDVYVDLNENGTIDGGDITLVQGQVFEADSVDLSAYTFRVSPFGTQNGGITVLGGTVFKVIGVDAPVSVASGTVSSLSGSFTDVVIGDGTPSDGTDAYATVGGEISVSGTITVKCDGKLTVTDTGAVTAGGIQNSGAVENAGTVSSDITNNTGGTVTNQSGGVLSGDVNNNGTLTNAGTASGDITNNSGGTVTNRSGGLLSGDMDNSGTAENAGTVSGDITNNTGGTVTNQSGGELSGNVNNSGSLENDGTVSGDFTNNSGGTATNQLGGEISGNVKNSSSLENSGTVSGDITNKSGGTVTNQSGGEISGGILNNSGGTVTNRSGGSLYGDIKNSGALENGGTVSGDVANNSGGTVTNQTGGSFSGDVKNGGTLENGGTVSGDITNKAGGTVTNQSGGELSGDVKNSGSLNNSGGITGAVTNNEGGTVGNETGGTIGGGLVNNGDVVNGGDISGDIKNSSGGYIDNSGGGTIGNNGSTDLENDGVLGGVKDGTVNAGVTATGSGVSSETSDYYVVTFDSNGGTNVSRQLVSAAVGSASAPVSPCRSGYAFIGWYSADDTQQTIVDFPYAVTGDTTLKAKWTTGNGCTGGSGGEGGGTGTCGETTAIFVDGEEYDIGTLTVEDDVTTVSIDNTVLAPYLEDASDSLRIPIDTDTSEAMAELTVGSIEKMAKKGMLIIPCGAKLPIIALIAGAMFGGAWWVAPSAYFLGIFAIVISGIMLKKTKMFAGDPAPFVMELPAYHWPTVGNLLRSMWERASSFIKKAGTVILLAAILIWFLSSFGVEGGSFGMVEDMENSVLAAIGSAIAWIFIPLGWGHWQGAVATITGLIAKENVVGTFGVLFGGFEEVAENGWQVWTNMRAVFTPLSAYSFLVFNLLCAPCFAAIGAIKREMNNAKWTWFAIGYQCVFAYAIALVFYQLGLLFSGNGNVIGSIVAFINVGFIAYMLFRPYKESETLKANVKVDTKIRV